jgi:hypothetical protein
MSSTAFEFLISPLNFVSALVPALSQALYCDDRELCETEAESRAVRRISPVRSSRPLTPRTARHHGMRTKRGASSCSAIPLRLLINCSAFSSKFVLATTKARRLISRVLQFDLTISPTKTSAMITCSDSLTFVRERGAQSIQAMIYFTP